MVLFYLNNFFYSRDTLSEMPYAEFTYRLQIRKLYFL